MSERMKADPAYDSSLKILILTPLLADYMGSFEGVKSGSSWNHR
jgi:hypothetical protein